ncbi:ribonuclease Y [Clostridia bacterium]|nr:ribonuclease Y [Clostridia bacterium]
MKDIIEIVVSVIISAGVAAIVCSQLFTRKGYDKGYDKGFGNGVEERKLHAEALIGSAEKEAERIIEDARKVVTDAEKDAQSAKRLAIVEAKDEIHKQRTEADREVKERRREVTNQERRIQQKEEQIDKKIDNIEKKEENLQNKLKDADNKLKEAEDVKRAQLGMLEKISEFSKEQARDYIIKSLETELDHEKAVKLMQFEQQYKDDADEKAKNLISLAIAKCASDHVTEATVSVVALPSDEMKGRIIGREGRNIRTLESLTGVDLIIDDTPEAITVSCFDQVRREVARLALEKLIQDGRIHPSRIEEMVDKARREVEQRIRQEGERAIMETNVRGVNHELIKLLGRLTFRTSYRQNVLNHSIETAMLAGVMAAEMKVDQNVARRAGLLHDIGKALTAEIEGSHVNLGVEVCKKYRENPDIIHAIEAHHGDVEARTPIACIVQAADAISAARPGARSENYENYIKRLQKLEEIACSFDGIERSFAIQAGREIRVMVMPEKITDDKMRILAREMANRIEKDMEYPGQVRVQLIRESRVSETAK